MGYSGEEFDPYQVDLFIESTNNITSSFGGNKPFETMEEFNDKMLLGETFKI